MSPPRQITKEEAKEEETKQEIVKVVSTGVKKIIRQPGVQDEHDEDFENNIKPDRPIDHISAEKISEMYATRLSANQKESLAELWGNFKGTKKYHNYTKEIKPYEAAACRYMM